METDILPGQIDDRSMTIVALAFGKSFLFKCKHNIPHNIGTSAILVHDSGRSLDVNC